MSASLFTVPGISCANCAAHIEEALVPLDGVNAVRVDVAAKQVSVDGTADESSLRSALAEAGYPAAG